MLRYLKLSVFISLIIGSSLMLQAQSPSKIIEALSKGELPESLKDLTKQNNKTSDETTEDEVLFKRVFVDKDGNLLDENGKIIENLDSLNVEEQKNLLTNDDKKEKEYKTFFEKYVHNRIIDPYETEVSMFKLNFDEIIIKLEQNRKIPGNYMVSPGDEVIINLWGGTGDAEYNLTINKENYIIIPKLGKVDLYGLNYDEMKEVIANKFPKNSGINYDIRIGKIKPISVNVFGNVKYPGIYKISPFSNLVEVLGAAGGVLDEGSLRNVVVAYGDGKKEIIDLYQALFYGENYDLIFRNNTTIVVPVLGPQAAVTGNVKKEAIFEIKDGERLSDILDISGLVPFADRDHIEIDRINENGRQTVISTSVDEDIKLKDGDIIRIFSTLVYNGEYVYLKGNFRHNKRIQYNKGMNLAHVFKDSTILKDDTDLEQSLIKRRNQLGKGNYFLRFSLDNVYNNNGDEKIELVPQDTIIVFNVDSTAFKQEVYVSGQVRNPGTYAYNGSMTVSDVVKIAGGLTPLGEIKNTLIKRMTLDGMKYYMDFNADRFELVAEDSVFFGKITNFKPNEYIKILGTVNKPGEYIYSKNITIDKLISLAEGIKEGALLDTIEIARGINSENDSLKVFKLPYSQKDNLKLYPNDVVHINALPGYGDERIVYVGGKVVKPGVYSVDISESLGDLERRFGGYTKDADVNGLRLFRKSIQKLQQDKISSLKAALSQKVKMIAVADKNINLAALPDTVQFDSLRALGRVVLDFDMGKENLFKHVTFENRDSIYVPSAFNTITVMGEVYQETSLIYNPNNTEVNYYLDKVGGMTDWADISNIYVIKTSGEIIKKDGWFSNTYTYDVEPGDLIFVPFNYDKVKSLEAYKDITNILYQLSVSAASIYSITK